MSNDNGTSAIQRRGLMLVLSSPSGAGKTTLSRQLLDNDKQIQLSVSCTTRQKRPGERDGVDYRFVDTATFRGMIERRQFLEYAEVFGNYYGTPRGPVDDALNAGKDMLFDIDWQGTQQLRDKGRADLVTVFILPPSTRDLEKRLLTRAQDPKEIVAQRMAKAADEMSHWAEYDYVVVNSDIGTSLTNLKAILTAERLKRERQVGMSGFVKALREGR
ncbi:MAG TPA: guanylate kinase [Steroidobacteraceae bacterium]|jgi:guanylate kinase|nr:guanylate kinase [Rhodospirillaceae bacterium]MEA2855095.1 guanylate kinase [Rhodospirillaceae bacterium]HEV7546120.1 guanylate kinase [Reyranella sp.]HJX21589.1 guanylate kinase [Steroidobacteraceae bacterium]